MTHPSTFHSLIGFSLHWIFQYFTTDPTQLGTLHRKNFQNLKSFLFKKGHLADSSQIRRQLQLNSPVEGLGDWYIIQMFSNQTILLQKARKQCLLAFELKLMIFCHLFKCNCYKAIRNFLKQVIQIDILREIQHKRTGTVFRNRKTIKGLIKYVHRNSSGMVGQAKVQLDNHDCSLTTLKKILNLIYGKQNQDQINSIRLFQTSQQLQTRDDYSDWLLQIKLRRFSQNCRTLKSPFHKTFFNGHMK